MALIPAGFAEVEIGLRIVVEVILVFYVMYKLVMVRKGEKEI